MLVLHLTQEMLQRDIDSVDLDLFLPMLSVVDQEKHKSTIPPLDCDNPMFYWILKNIDFAKWSSASCSQVLWLSGPLERNIHQILSYMVDQEKNRGSKTQHFVLYFFCSAAVKEKSIIEVFVHTLLYQIVCTSPMDKRILIVRSFLHSLLEGTPKKEEAPNWKWQGSKVEDTLYANIKKILNAPANALWAALKAVLGEEQQRDLLVVVDGLDTVGHQKREFTKGVREFVAHLLNRTSKFKALLISRPQAEIKEVFDGVPCIEFDKERKGSATPYFLTLNSAYSNE
jgi:ankyrin repeat domain-containing protein 50